MTYSSTTGASFHLQHSSENQRYTSVSISQFSALFFVFVFLFSGNLFERFVYMQQQLLMNLCTTHIPLAVYAHIVYLEMHKFKRDFNKQFS